MSIIRLTKTPAGKSKLVDQYGFCVATAPDATKESDLNFEKLYECWRILRLFPLEKLKEINEFNPEALITKDNFNHGK